MAACIIKYGSIPSAEVTKSDFTIEFSVVDLAGNKFFDFEQPAAWQKYYLTPFTFRIHPLKKRISQQTSINKTLFPAKSTTLNLIV